MKDVITSHGMNCTLMHAERNPRGLVVQVDSESETVLLGQALARVVTPGTVIGLIGPLGAGKTRLSRALAESLGVDPGAIASPTFVLIHEYEGTIPVYHFDTYRLNDPDEFEALGVEDYWNGPGVCLVEWADRVADLLPASCWTIRIEPLSDSRRLFHMDWPEDDGTADRFRQYLASV